MSIPKKYPIFTPELHPLTMVPELFFISDTHNLIDLFTLPPADVLVSQLGSSQFPGVDSL